MPTPDLNLLVTLDVLLAEGSVARAARRLRLSPSAMSRALQRLREATGDPLLVRAGRGLVATPRALELREEVGRIVEEARAVLRPAEALDLASLARTFTIRSSEGFVETFGPGLIDQVGAVAPGVRLRFVQKPDRDSAPLRDGTVDLETGVVGKTTGPEIRAQALFRDRFVGAVRISHTDAARAGMHTCPLPLPIPDITVSLLWHPRLDADPAHRWLRGCVRESCAEVLAASSRRDGTDQD